MLHSTIGNLLIDGALPPDMRDPARGPLDKKAVAALFDDLAWRHPDQYGAVAGRLLDVGRDVATGTGGFSFGLGHMRPTRAGEAIKARVVDQIRAIRARRDLADDARDRAVVAALQAAQKPLEDAVFEESRAEGNPLARQVMNVGRGNRTSLRSLRAGDLLYEDHHGRPIPVPILSSYSQGLKPSEYWAAGFGARKGVVDVKFATQASGYLSKQLNQVTHRLVVTADDADAAPATPRGLPVDAADPDNAGALLARATGTYPRNTPLTPAILHDLETQGHRRILVRSPMVGGPPEGGVYARDAGVRERGMLAPRGDFVGIAAAQALSEKLTQGQLSSKHAGGVAGAGQAVSGFKSIDQLIQVPRTFPGGAAHAERDGRVRAVAPAPQGGHYVDVAGVRHYVPQGQTPAVAEGQDVEAGDALSDGIPNPAEIVRHKGIGAGRAHFVKAFMDAYRGAGMQANRRNVELLARGLIDHVRLTEEMGDHVEDDVVPYQALEAAWEPRAGARAVAPAAAVGKYLEAPALHHTIGARIRPSMLRDFADFGVKELLVHDDPPPFEPVMIRGLASLAHDPDFLTRHLGSNLERSTLEAVHRGRSSDIAGTSYVPAIAADRGHFGRQGLTRGWSPRDGDGDGRVRDGTPLEAPKPRSILGG